MHHVAAQAGLRGERAKALYCGAASLKHPHNIHSHKSVQGAERGEGGGGCWVTRGEPSLLSLSTQELDIGELQAAYSLSRKSAHIQYVLIQV